MSEKVWTVCQKVKDCHVGVGDKAQAFELVPQTPSQKHSDVGFVAGWCCFFHLRNGITFTEVKATAAAKAALHPATFVFMEFNVPPTPKRIWRRRRRSQEVGEAGTIYT